MSAVAGMPLGTSPSLTDAVIELLGDRTVAVAETCTAGRIAQVLCGARDAPSWFRGGLVLSDPRTSSVLGLADVAPSTSAVEDLVRSAAQLLQAEVGLATILVPDDPGVGAAVAAGAAGDVDHHTGVIVDLVDGVARLAEPDEELGPSATVIIATLVDGMTWVKTRRFGGDLNAVAEQACRQALLDLWSHLRHESA